MKFQKPRVLSENNYPDADISQPKLFKKLVNEVIYPLENSPLDKYIETTVSFLKEKIRLKNKKVDVNLTNLGESLFFAKLCLKDHNTHNAVRALIDTGAANSLLHESVVRKYNIKYEPASLRLCTANGFDDHAIIGKCHLQFVLHDSNNRHMTRCTNFIISKKLNNLECILGAEFLFSENKTITLDKNNLSINECNISFKTKIYSDDTFPLNCTTMCAESMNLTCGSCENNPVYIKNNMIYVKNLRLASCADINVNNINMPLDFADFTRLELCDVLIPPIPPEDDISDIPLPSQLPSLPLPSLFPTLPNSTPIKDNPTQGSIPPIPSIPSNNINVMSHSVKDIYDNEKLPNSEEFFDENQEIKFEALEKKFTIEDGDFKDCPRTHLKQLKSLLNNFKDRFSTFKLDVEVTDMYTADLETEPGKKVIQKCRRLANHKFQFGYKAIKQLEKAGVVRPSDSEWRSNVVMVPKPVSSSQLRTVTKADMQSGKQHKAELYRLCLDFRDLNKLLVFPKQCQFTTLDQFLHKLKNKVVVSLDISSSFFIIPINEKDRYKTAFWLNDYAYEFNVLVMGLKSSPYHLKRFIDKVFSSEAFAKFSSTLSEEEKLLLPESFAEIIISYFDDCFIFADNYDKLLVALKLVLMVAREAKVKFSIEKSSFFTENIKILGYSFNTRETILTMDKLKASAILNMKKPSSLYELHSRLSSFQYQSVFIPYLKHISYPLQFLLRKNEFRWTEIEELSWQLLKQVSTLNLRLTIPDSQDNLVLTTDASKIAASANLFREKNGKLELVAVNSKFFSTTDLNKCSYVLESIALAYGLKIYSAYLLNCTGTIKIFTDAKSLIYAKRNATHSILLNSALTYITNFVSLVNIEIYHIPGTINRLADIMSRAISDNLQCGLTKEHPISKEWAKTLPPLQENFAVTRDVLFEFLTKPLKPEVQDIHCRIQKRLSESKSIQQEYDETLRITPEHKYYCGLRMLEQFNDKYLNSWASTKLHNTDVSCVYLSEAKIIFDGKRKEMLFEKVKEIVDKLYTDPNDKRIHRKLITNLKEVAMQLIKYQNDPLQKGLSVKLDESVDDLLDCISNTEKILIEKKVDKEIKNNIIYVNTLDLKTEKELKVLFQLAPFVTFKPKICDLSNGWDMPLQEQITLDKMEHKKVDLGIKIILPKGYCALLINKSSARVKYGVHVFLGLIDIGFHNYMQVVIQNVSDKKITLPTGTAVCQLLVLKCKIPKFELAWEDLESRDGSFGSTGQNFERVNTNHCSIKIFRSPKFENLVSSAMDLIDPHTFSINNINVRLLGSNSNRCDDMTNLLDFEKRSFTSSISIMEKLPILETYNLQYDNIDTDEIENDEDPEYFEKISTPKLTEKDETALLAADLCENKKISLTLFSQLQDLDKNITKIKNDIVENRKVPKYFVLKNDILCRQYTIKSNSSFFMGVYIPDSILYAVIIYIHKFFNHPSLTQTFKEFRNLYYHPRAKQAVKNVCEACMICASNRNFVRNDKAIGKQRTLNPKQPREAISMDILYFPKSARGHTHGLLIVDLYSMYLSFYPLKSKSSSSVCKALRDYISHFSVPKAVYSDCDQSFRGEVEQLFFQYKIEHHTSYPYTQKQNTVEGHVRLFKNSYRCALSENDIFKHRDWDFLYPLIVTRINSLISKYGLSREAVQFGYTSENNLPIITDSALFEPLEKDLEEASKLFKARVGKFINRKKDNKRYYKDTVKNTFGIHELIMYKENNPSDLLSPTFSGPARIMDLQETGAEVRDLKTSDRFLVTFDKMRKINFDKFLTILPKNYDSEINAKLKTYRYRRTDDDVTEIIEKPTDGKLGDMDIRQTRSGKVYSVSINLVSPKYIRDVDTCTVTVTNKKDSYNETKKRSCLKKRYVIRKIGVPEIPDIVPHYDLTQLKQMAACSVDKIRKFKEPPKKSTFVNGKNCTVRMDFVKEPEHRKVKFSHALIIFYE